MVKPVLVAYFFVQITEYIKENNELRSHIFFMHVD